MRVSINFGLTCLDSPHLSMSSYMELLIGKQQLPTRWETATFLSYHDWLDLLLSLVRYSEFHFINKAWSNKQTKQKTKHNKKKLHIHLSFWCFFFNVYVSEYMHVYHIHTGARGWNNHQVPWNWS